MALVATPTLLLPAQGGSASSVVVLVAIFAAIFTVVEYTVDSPSFIEFRSAPPFNRLRFAALFVTVLTISLTMSDADGSALVSLVEAAAFRIGDSLDFPFSPVRLILLMMAPSTTPETLAVLRAAAGVAYFMSILATMFFIVLLRWNRWPRRNDSFNVWINLPMFDPTGGGDVVARLSRDGQVNLVLGYLLPFLIPAVGKMVSMFGMPIVLDDPQTMIWMVAAWAFLPASLLMRGIALTRVAQMIHMQRKRAYRKAAAEGLLPA
ncbi:hypothetical protein EU805_02605 [Salipiger sp. IMCC34102]|nr:hypothetical protein EU805_02605 [Salipiger sp. IMCC34102]